MFVPIINSCISLTFEEQIWILSEGSASKMHKNIQYYSIDYCCRKFYSISPRGQYGKILKRDKVSLCLNKLACFVPIINSCISLTFESKSGHYQTAEEGSASKMHKNIQYYSIGYCCIKFYSTSTRGRMVKS